MVTNLKRIKWKYINIYYFIQQREWKDFMCNIMIVHKKKNLTKVQAVRIRVEYSEYPTADT